MVTVCACGKGDLARGRGGALSVVCQRFQTEQPPRSRRAQASLSRERQTAQWAQFKPADPGHYPTAVVGLLGGPHALVDVMFSENRNDRAR
jgi:hypothetical protein